MNEYPRLAILNNLGVGGNRAPLNVLTLTPFYPSKGDDAGGCFIAEPLRALAKLGIANSVLAVQPFYRETRQKSQAVTDAQWLRYFSLPGGLGLPSAGAFLFARIVGLVRGLQSADRIDLIHAHGPLPCGHAAMLLSAELGIPFVVSVHGLDAFSTEQVQGRAGTWCRRISQRIFRSSRRVICISEHVREKVLEGTGSSCRTSVVYNAVDSELFSPPNEPPAAQIILSVGNLIPIKGHDTLIKAFASIKGEFPELTAEIIGTGPELKKLQKLATQNEVQQRVRFLGRESRAHVADAMRRCTVFALPSRYEGLGCVYLEAMSAARSVIGCREQGIAEVIQHGSNGFLVGPENEKELAVALSILLGDPSLRQKLGARARDMILDGFTLAHQAERLARIYRECAG